MKKKNEMLTVITAILIIAGIVIAGLYVFFYEETQPKEEAIEESKNGIIDDRVSPLVNQAVSLEIGRIHKKGIENVMRKIGNSWKDKPRYHFVATLDTGLWEGKDVTIWDTGYVGWESFRFVENETEDCKVEIKILETKTERQLLKKVSYDVEIEKFTVTYNFKTGRWTGDDFVNDSDGYGHYNGEHYEIWFDIRNSDYDGDGIPYWTEVNILHTDPMVDDSHNDSDGDGIPIPWEWKWGYDPFVADNHSTIDPEKDGLSNLVEYDLRKWLADPYQQDIYIEADFMEKEPGLFGHEHVFWKESQYMMVDKFSEHGIAVHIDDGCMGGGGEYLEYYESYINQASGKASEYYKYHFADERKGIFRYLFIHHSGGWIHPQDYKLRYDVISIPSSKNFYKNVFDPLIMTPRLERIAMAVSVMHELGHSLGLMPEYCAGIDNLTQIGRGSDLPFFQDLKARKAARDYWSGYESCMNYAKFGALVLGYSDGSRGEHDADDWDFIDLTYFQRASPQMEGIE